MASPQINGEVTQTSDSSSSAFLQHLSTYPLIQDGLTSFKSNPYGQRSIKLGDSAYKTFAAPVLPYLAKPYEYVSPYVQKADSFGDKTLDRIDERFPVVRKPTSDLYNDTRELILFPYNKGLEGRDHVFQVYNDAIAKARGDNVITHGKALIDTALVVSTETLSWLSNAMAGKKEQVAQTIRADEKGNK